MRSLPAVLIIFAFTACSGDSTSEPPTQSIATSAVTLYNSGGPAITQIGETVVVQPNGSATVVYKTSPPQTFTATIPMTLLSKLYRDVNAALPLAALPDSNSLSPPPPAIVTVSIAGQTSPNILQDSGIAGTLDADASAIDGVLPQPNAPASTEY